MPRRCAPIGSELRLTAARRAALIKSRPRDPEIGEVRVEPGERPGLLGQPRRELPSSRNAGTPDPAAIAEARPLEAIDVSESDLRDLASRRAALAVKDRLASHHKTDGAGASSPRHGSTSSRFRARPPSLRRRCSGPIRPHGWT
jgi:hypothetical protein